MRTSIAVEVSVKNPHSIILAYAAVPDGRPSRATSSVCGPQWGENDLNPFDTKHGESRETVVAVRNNVRASLWTYEFEDTYVAVFLGPVSFRGNGLPSTLDPLVLVGNTMLWNAFV
jgi:hypothetical protein